MPETVRFRWSRYEVMPGASAEVTGITSARKRDQRGMLVITRPGQRRPKVIRLGNKYAVSLGMKFAAEYNAACQDPPTPGSTGFPPTGLASGLAVGA